LRWKKASSQTMIGVGSNSSIVMECFEGSVQPRHTAWSAAYPMHKVLRGVRGGALARDALGVTPGRAGRPNKKSPCLGGRGSGHRAGMRRGDSKKPIHKRTQIRPLQAGRNLRRSSSSTRYYHIGVVVPLRW
jgi:hypothetical protein